jgi:PKD repeat protein
VTDEPDMDRPPALRYAWDFGNGSTSTEAAPTHTYDTAGTWTVRLTVTDDQGAAATTSTTVTSTTASVAPAAPTGLRQTRSGLNGSSYFIDFAWDATKLATSYQISVRCDGCWPLSGTFAATQVRLNGASPSTTYLVSVRARSADGTWSPWTPEIKARV